MMRVLADTNIYISHLISSLTDTFVHLLFEQVAEEKVTLLIAEPILDELVETIGRKPYLTKAIPSEKLTLFITLLRQISEPIPLLTAEIPKFTRDPKDDYLIAYSVFGRADYLISLDKDLLVLGQFGQTKVVHSAEFREILSTPPE